mgnify:CR=1 FL=1
MTPEEKEDFIGWLGFVYLDFDNAHPFYINATKKEIKDKLDEYDTSRKRSKGVSR